MSNTLLHITAAKRTRTAARTTRWSRTRFGQTVEKAGFVLGGDKENSLSKQLALCCLVDAVLSPAEVDSAVFQRELGNALKKSTTSNVVSPVELIFCSMQLNKYIWFRMFRSSLRDFVTIWIVQTT